MQEGLKGRKEDGNETDKNKATGRRESYFKVVWKAN